MRSFAACILVAGVGLSAASRFFEQCDTLFTEFQTRWRVKYSDDAERTQRRDLFCANMLKADKLNEENGSDSFGVSKFADRTDREYSVLLGRKGHGAGTIERGTRIPRTNGEPQVYVDWHAKGKVTPVKNQGQCGSCWAHSAAEAIESQFAIDDNALWEFSQQQIASCTRNCFGCGGGDTPAAYDYLMSLPEGQGLGSAAFAPYVQSMYTECLAKSCTEACSSIDVPALETYSSLTGFYASVVGYDYATTPCTDACASQNMTMLALNMGDYAPPSICVNAANWNLYTGGVMTQAACGGYAYSDLDHCVQVRHTHTHTHTLAHAHTYSHIHTCIHTHTHTHTRTHTQYTHKTHTHT